MSSTPKPPKTLGPVGGGLWRRVAGDVQPGWLLDERDLALLLAACQSADRAAELEELVASEGMTVKGSRGQSILHPAVGEARLQRQLGARLLGRCRARAAGSQDGAFEWAPAR